MTSLINECTVKIHETATFPYNSVQCRRNNICYNTSRYCFTLVHFNHMMVFSCYCFRCLLHLYENNIPWRKTNVCHSRQSAFLYVKGHVQRFFIPSFMKLDVKISTEFSIALLQKITSFLKWTTLDLKIFIQKTAPLN